MPCLKPPDLSPSFSIPTLAPRWLFAGFEITWSSTVASPRCQSVMMSRSVTRRWKGLEGVGEVAIGNSDLDLAERDLIQLDLLFLQGWKEGMAFNIDGIATAIWGLIVDMPVVVGVSHGTSHPDQAAGDSNFQIQGIPCRNGGTQRIIPNPGWKSH